MQKKQKPSSEEIYDMVIRNKSAKEKIKMVDGFFKYAKKVNPKAFRWSKPLKPRQIY